MVNVGGRSKGCSNCRQRRVKCDERRPVCVRCEKIGLQCTGAKETAFIDSSSRFQIERRRKEPKPPSRKATNNAIQVTGPLYHIPQALGLQFVEDDICINYTKNKILRGGPIEVASELIQSLIPSEHTKYSKILQHAVMGLSTSFFGTQHMDPHITRLGSLRYGAALRGLNGVLSDPRCYMNDYILLSIVTLVMYEGLYPTGHDHYLKHVSGLEQLLALRGPTSVYASPIATRIFRALRRVLIFACTGMSKVSIMARDEWRQEPGDNWSAEDLQQEVHVDFLAKWMLLRSERDAFAARRWEHSDTDLDVEYESILRKANILKESLDAWRREWLQETTSGQQSALTATPDFGHDLSYAHKAQVLPIEWSSQTTGSALMLYNISLIHLLEILDSLPSLKPKSSAGDNERTDQYPTPQSPVTEPAPGEQPTGTPINIDYRSIIREAALEICRGLKYQLAHKSKVGNPTLLVGYAAVKTAFGALGGIESTEGRALYDLVMNEATVAKKRGFRDSTHGLSDLSTSDVVDESLVVAARNRTLEHHSIELFLSSTS